MGQTAGFSSLYDLDVACGCVDGRESMEPDVRRYIRSLTIMDNEFMARFFDGQNECVRHLVETVLGRDDLEVSSSRTLFTLPSLTGRSVQLDVHATDSEGRLYDIEVQRDPRGATPRRARLYASYLDTDALARGEHHEALPEAYVIFLVEGDALGRGRSLYTVERKVLEEDLTFRDGSHIVYVDASAAGERRSAGTPLGDLVHDLRCPDPDRMRSTLFAERAHMLKGDEKEATAMNEYKERILREAREEGLEMGREEGRKEGARLVTAAAERMVKLGSLSLATIADVLGMPVAEVERIAERMGQQGAAPAMP